MNEHDWVCKNCHAQNAQSDPTCRVCGLAAPPGAGKTTLLTFLEKLSRERGDIGAVQIIGDFRRGVGGRN